MSLIVNITLICFTLKILFSKSPIIDLPTDTHTKLSLFKPALYQHSDYHLFESNKDFWESKAVYYNQICLYLLK